LDTVELVTGAAGGWPGGTTGDFGARETVSFSVVLVVGPTWAADAPWLVAWPWFWDAPWSGAWP
jgi:hypothetical protein